MTWVLVGLGVWLILLGLVWSLCVAAGRADARSVAQDEAMRPAPAGSHAAPERVAHEPAAVVADAGRLRTHLAATAVVLRAERVALVTPLRDEEVVIAHAGSATTPPGAESVTVPAGSATLLVAERVGGRFDAADRRLLTSLAASLHDVVGVPDPGPPSSGRFSSRRAAPSGQPPA
jgi:hypothetical protein